MDVAELGNFLLDCVTGVAYIMAIAGIATAAIGSLFLYIHAGRTMGAGFIRFLDGKTATTKDEIDKEGRSGILLAGGLLVTILALESARSHPRVQEYLNSYHYQSRFSTRQELGLFGARVMVEAFFLLLVLGAVGWVFGPKKQPIQQTAASFKKSEKDNDKTK